MSADCVALDMLIQHHVPVISRATRRAIRQLRAAAAAPRRHGRVCCCHARSEKAGWCLQIRPRNSARSELVNVASAPDRFEGRCGRCRTSNRCRHRRANHCQPCSHCAESSSARHGTQTERRVRTASISIVSLRPAGGTDTFNLVTIKCRSRSRGFAAVHLLHSSLAELRRVVERWRIA